MFAAQDWVNGSYPHRNLFDAAEASGLKIMHKLILEGAVSLDAKTGQGILNASIVEKLKGYIRAVRHEPALLGYFVCDDCCSDPHLVSALSQTYAVIKDLDPYHVTTGGVECPNAWQFSDRPSLLPPTADRSEPWLSSGQPQLQLFVDLVMQENYCNTLACQGTETTQLGVGWNPHMDRDARVGMWQEPLVNSAGTWLTGGPAASCPADDVHCPTFHTLLWLAAIVSDMPAQIAFDLAGPGADSCNDPAGCPSARVQNTVAAYSAEVQALKPSLLAPFGMRDNTTASFVQEANLSVDLRVRAWQENADCVHVAVANVHATHDHDFTVSLAGDQLPPGGGSGLNATRVLGVTSRDHYSVPVSVGYTFADAIGPALFFLYRVGGGCSGGAARYSAIVVE